MTTGRFRRPDRNAHTESLTMRQIFRTAARPYPPRRTKSRCLSMTSSAVRTGPSRNGPGTAGHLQGQVHAGSPVVAEMTAVEVDTAPKTPPCMVTMCRAASWLAGSVAPVRTAYREWGAADQLHERALGRQVVHTVRNWSTSDAHTASRACSP